MGDLRQRGGKGFVFVGRAAHGEISRKAMGRRPQVGESALEMTDYGCHFLCNCLVVSKKTFIFAYYKSKVTSYYIK